MDSPLKSHEIAGAGSPFTKHWTVASRPSLADCTSSVLSKDIFSTKKGRKEQKTNNKYGQRKRNLYNMIVSTDKRTMEINKNFKQKERNENCGKY